MSKKRITNTNNNSQNTNIYINVSANQGSPAPYKKIDKEHKPKKKFNFIITVIISTLLSYFLHVIIPLNVINYIITLCSFIGFTILSLLNKFPKISKVAVFIGLISGVCLFYGGSYSPTTDLSDMSDPTVAIPADIPALAEPNVSTPEDTVISETLHNESSHNNETLFNDPNGVPKTPDNTDFEFETSRLTTVIESSLGFNSNNTYMEVCYTSIDGIKNMVNTKEQEVTSQTINSNIEFTNLIAAANALDSTINRSNKYHNITLGESIIGISNSKLHSLSSLDVLLKDEYKFQDFFSKISSDPNLITELNNQLIDIYKEKTTLEIIVQLREEAIKIYDLENVSKLLSNDYLALGNTFKYNNKYSEAADCYLHSIEKRINQIKFFDELDDNFYKQMYEIATTYHALADILPLSNEDRELVLVLSATIYEDVSKNASDNYLSTYYCAMTNHKIFIVRKPTFEISDSDYINDAFIYYKQAKHEFPDNRDLAYQNDYLSQICTHSINYLSEHENNLLLLTEDEYKEYQKSLH